MSIKRLLVVAVVAMSISSLGFAQSSDPFGGSGATDLHDPFAAPNQPKPSSVNSKPTQMRRVAKRPPIGENQVVTIGSDNASEARILASLDDETSIQFIETPLGEAMQNISDMHKIPIVIDRQSLEELGIATDVPVTLALEHVTLRSALRLMLRSLDLTYVIEHEVLMVTTAEASEQRRVIKMYRLPKAMQDKSEEIVEVMRETLSPTKWQSSGGTAAISALDNILIVSVNEPMHHEVENFLRMLCEAYFATEE